MAIIIILSIALGGAAVLLRGAYVRQKELMAEVEKWTKISKKDSDLALNLLDLVDYAGKHKPKFVIQQKNNRCELYALYEIDKDDDTYSVAPLLKVFADSDPEYNLNCANELKEKLEERV